MDESLENLMTEIRGRLDLLESSLPTRVDAMVSPESKLPFKALIYRAALIWRMAELSRGAFENFEKDKLALACLERTSNTDRNWLAARLDTSAGIIPYSENRFLLYPASPRARFGARLFARRKSRYRKGLEPHLVRSMTGQKLLRAEPDSVRTRMR
jgi:hypothetical protein